MPSPILTSCLPRRATNSFVDWEDPIFQDPASRLVEPQIIVYEAPVCHAHNAKASISSNFSACGFTALNYVRLAWKLEIEGTTDAELLRRMISQVMIDDTMKIRKELNADTYLDIGESLEVPIFEKTLVLDPATTLHHVPEIDNLKPILLAWFSQTPRSVRATVLSQSGEVILCLRIPVIDSTVYALFDCHPRSHHPHAPAFILSKCLDDIIAVANNIFSEARKDIPLGNADPYHYLSVHCIGPDPHGHLLDVEELLSNSISHLRKRSAAALASDHLALLKAQAEQRKRQLKSVVEPSCTENQDKSEAMPVPSGSSSLTKSSGLDYSQSISARRHSEFGWQLALLRTLEPASSGDSTPKPYQDPAHTAFDNVDNKENIAPTPPAKPSISRTHEYATTEEINNPPLEPNAVPSPQDNSQITPVLPEMEAEEKTDSQPQIMKEKFPAMVPIDYPSLSHQVLETETTMILEPSASTSVTYERDYSWEAALACQLQEEEELTMMMVSRHRAYRDTYRDTAWLIALQRSIEEERLASSSTSAGAGAAMDWQLAVQLQQEEANASSSASTEGSNTPANSSTFTTLQLPHVLESFECGVCAEVHNVAVKISLPICGHMFCKECLTTYTKTKIDDGRYPIFCPECVAERPRAIKTQLSEDVIQQLCISEESLTRLQELQLVLHCITLQCPRCKEVMNVDRVQFAQESVLVCPLPRCGHKWCKSCLKALANSQQHHRCKNSNIDRLMKRKGWKYCPGCRTPVQKETGCNHMTCGTPGCNVHFCYKCGVLMIDTTNGGDVGTAVTEHYIDCQLFEKRWKCSIQ